MAPRTAALSDLIRLADEVLEAEGPVHEIIGKIETYFDDFEACAGELQHTQKPDEETLKLLAEKHAAILSLTTTLRDDTSNELKALKRRGKGILAYTDIYPKRISLNRERKG